MIYQFKCLQIVSWTADNLFDDILANEKGQLVNQPTSIAACFRVFLPVVVVVVKYTARMNSCTFRRRTLAAMERCAVLVNVVTLEGPPGVD